MHGQRFVLIILVGFCIVLYILLILFMDVVVGVFDVHNIHTIVLDEMDTLLDDSFNELVMNILQKITVCNVVYTRLC